LNGNGTSKQEYRKRLRELIHRICSSGSRVILCTPTVIGEKIDGTNPQDSMLDDYAEVSRSVAQETEVDLCDLHSAFRTYLSTHNHDNAGSGILTQDGVHLNETGNALVAEKILEHLKNEKLTGRTQ
jgi:lysophospholipase L1-like esterase